MKLCKSTKKIGELKEVGNNTVNIIEFLIFFWKNSFILIFKNFFLISILYQYN